MSDREDLNLETGFTFAMLLDGECDYMDEVRECQSSADLYELVSDIIIAKSDYYVEGWTELREDLLQSVMNRIDCEQLFNALHEKEVL